MLGAQLGQYRIMDVVGGGGMGVVFRARQEMIERDVALKLLPPELAHDEINSKRLEREAKALARLNHPNIVTTFDFGLTAHGQAYLVMELVDGESLKEMLLREGRLELGRALRIFVQMADAMRFAHNSGIVHRDLKPHNVMIAQTPSADFVKILDFGIASLADSQKLTRVGEIIGSPLYMSPEQCLSEPVDNRTDIYSLGVLMFVALTGQVPFKGETLYETIERKCTEPIPRLADIAPDVEVPGFLEELIRHCLAVEPRDRLQNMDEVKDLLESIPVRKAVPSDATIVFDKPSVTKEPVVPAKTIKERMADSAESKKSQPKPRPSSRNSAALANSAARPIRSRPLADPGAIVLTPGMLMLGILAMLAFMVVVVVSAVAFITNGTLLPPAQQQQQQQQRAEQAGGTADSGTTAFEQTPETTVKQAPEKQAPALPQPQANVPKTNPVGTSTKPSPADVQQKPHIRPNTQVPVPRKVVRKPAPRTHTAPPADLPMVRHGGHRLAPKTDFDRWETFKNRP